MIPTSSYLNLQRLILALAALSALAMLGNALWASHEVQRQQLLDSTLQANRLYASQLAQTTQHFITGSEKQLAYSAARIGRALEDGPPHAEETDRLKHQSSAFNTVALVDAHGVLRAASPALPGLVGTTLTTSANQQALQRRAPMVSDAHIAPTGHLVVNLSHPVFDRHGAYAGYITASIHLREKNVLHTLLGANAARDGSYLYIVGKDGTLLYHPEPARIGQPATRNAAVRALAEGKAGATHSVNSHGVHMLAGFAPVPAAGWGVVAQRPVAATLSPLRSLTFTVLRNAAPLGVLSLLLIWYLSGRIAAPLGQLARTAQAHDVGQAIDEVKGVNSWYYEAAQLKRAVLASFRSLSERIGRLDQATLTDPLTQLLNRRGLERALGELGTSGLPFGVIAVDVDHFKRINDRFGHASGDQVIAGLAAALRRNARPQDVLCRLGGEEFLVLLPEVDAATALQIAERLRTHIEAQVFEGIGQITLSAGVSHFPQTHADADLVIRQADKALYRAKQAGRNMVVLYQRRGDSRG